MQHSDSSNIPRYEDITETTGGTLTREAAQMMYTRYALAAEASAGRRVLELGCGAGLGLGWVSREASLAVGGDYSAALLDQGRSHYGDRVNFVRLSAEALPFPTAAFELVLFFEASYYVPDMERSFDEIRRVLAPGGAVIFANANPSRPDFVPSPFSIHYHSAAEFQKALERRGFTVGIEGAFPLRESSGVLKDIVGSLMRNARRVAVATRLVPRTLKGRARLKRLLFGKLRAIPPEIEPGFSEPATRTPIAPEPARDWKVIYVRGTRQESSRA
jgi:ubiquinone/menaquinone biosynthesis C-methylase UbiE